MRWGGEVERRTMHGCLVLARDLFSISFFFFGACKWWWWWWNARNLSDQSCGSTRAGKKERQVKNVGKGEEIRGSVSPDNAHKSWLVVVRE